MAADFLLKLFANYGQDYSCTNTKLGKLLTIVAIKFANKNERIFLEDVVKYGDCGAVVGGLSNINVEFYFRDITLGHEFHDNEQLIENLPCWTNTIRYGFTVYTLP